MNFLRKKSVGQLLELQQVFSLLQVFKKTIDGYPVTKIGEKAFHNSPSLTGIVLPHTINQIGREAFSACKKLQYVSFATKAYTNLNIGERAFFGCTKLKRFQASERRAIVHPQAFACCDALHFIDCKVNHSALNNKQFFDFQFTCNFSHYCFFCFKNQLEEDQLLQSKSAELLLLAGCLVTGS